MFLNLMILAIWKKIGLIIDLIYWLAEIFKSLRYCLLCPFAQLKLCQWSLEHFAPDQVSPSASRPCAARLISEKLVHWAWKNSCRTRAGKKSVELELVEILFPFSVHIYIRNINQVFLCRWKYWALTERCMELYFLHVVVSTFSVPRYFIYFKLEGIRFFGECQSTSNYLIWQCFSAHSYFCRMNGFCYLWVQFGFIVKTELVIRTVCDK